MADIRKNDLSVLLSIRGNKSEKIEIFKGDQFSGGSESDQSKLVFGSGSNQRYRIRVNGRWHPEGERKFYYKSQVLDFINSKMEF